MLKAFAVLLGCQLVGESLHRIFSLWVPGPVIGMFLLALLLLRKPSAIPEALVSTTRVLLQLLGLLFVPAGVGVIGNLNLIGREWIPILVALVGSTFLSLFVTAYVMHRISSPSRVAVAASILSDGKGVQGSQS
jgi:holin-like protein